MQASIELLESMVVSLRCLDLVLDNSGQLLVNQIKRFKGSMQALVLLQRWGRSTPDVLSATLLGLKRGQAPQ